MKSNKIEMKFYSILDCINNTKPNNLKQQCLSF
jgi:hypothetical protein